MRETIHDMLQILWNVTLTITVLDIIDIVLLTYFIYLLLKLVRETRANQLMKGIAAVVLAYFLSRAAKLKAINYIITKALDIGLVAILVVFQPELRRALEQVGRTKFGSAVFGRLNTDELSGRWLNTIEAVCDACAELSETCTGALIVIEQGTRLGEQIATGTTMQALPSKELLCNIFYPKTPLHDGAVILRDGQILAAACYLPKPAKEELINKKLGSRHRAAIGMSESSDAIIIVVSEETGQISIAENGVLTRDYTADTLRERLRGTLLPKATETGKRSKKNTKKQS